MTQPSITLVIKDYDYVAPLACGDVTPDGIDLNLVRDTPNALNRTLSDASIDAGELSMSRQIMRLSSGDNSFIAIPFFAYRAFRQRCFFTLRDAHLKGLEDLGGRRIGTNEWPASGNVWSRALIREQGIEQSNISWSIGPLENPNAPVRPQGLLPNYVKIIEPGRTLCQMLLDGELDALMVPVPPKDYYQPGYPIVRMLEDYRTAEREYYQRTQLYPPHHLIGIRRKVFERDPWIARSLFDALEKSRRHWQERIQAWAEISPWFLAEWEDVTTRMGTDWQPNGVKDNTRALQSFCDELLGQEIIDRPFDPELIFTDFEKSLSLSAYELK